MCPLVGWRQNVFRSEVLASHCHCCEESKNQELHNRQLSDDSAAFLDSWRYLFPHYPLKTQLKLKISSIFPLQVQAFLAIWKLQVCQIFQLHTWALVGAGSNVRRRRSPMAALWTIAQPFCQDGVFLPGINPDLSDPLAILSLWALEEATTSGPHTPH